MRVEQLGEGDPEIAIVAAIHGDEPCGVHAVETLRDEPPALTQPVKCVIANERARDRDVRYINTDLNRAFPGEPNAEAYEQQLAADLLDELRGCTTLALHATKSTATPFAITPEIGPLAETVCPQLSIEALVEAGACVETALGAYIDAIEVECGRQGTEQASETAVQLVSEFLAATGAIPDIDAPERTLPVYRLHDCLPKRDATAYDVLATNFERVDTGAPYATINGEPQIAEEAFYPVLLSANGYESQFGYAAELTDNLEPTRETSDEGRTTEDAVALEAKQ
jgi:predicted deacylase